MKANLFIALLGITVLTVVSARAQKVEVAAGPELPNTHTSKIVRIIDGGKDSFYCFRDPNNGNSFIVEKYDKKTLVSGFSKELDYGDKVVVPVGFFYSMNNVYFFTRSYDYAGRKVLLNCQTLTSLGELSGQMPLTSIAADHDGFVDFEISLNPSGTKFLIKACHRQHEGDVYKTDFILKLAAGLKQGWTQTVETPLFKSAWQGDKNNSAGKSDIRYLGCWIDNSDNLFYTYMERSLVPGEKEKRFTLKLGILRAPGSSPIPSLSSATTRGAVLKPDIYDLPLNRNCDVDDIVFFSPKPDQLLLAGFMKDVISGPPYPYASRGVFSFTINILSGKPVSSPVKMFDRSLLHTLQPFPDLAPYYKYRMDHVFPIGGDLFFVGEVYSEKEDSDPDAEKTGGSSVKGEYKYLDVIIAKMNAKGEFEWVKNSPMRNEVNLRSALRCNPYFAMPTKKNIYIFNNDHAENLKLYGQEFLPKEIKGLADPSAGALVVATVAVSDGAIKHKLLKENKPYCFNPLQQHNPMFATVDGTRLFVTCDSNEAYFYSEAQKNEQFTRLSIPE